MEIKVLDHQTIDKIAAGEVVERPASVVKELVENAMDSGADNITVEIKEGGIAMIRVTDNGCGIPKDQVAKAFLRHSTSKIRTADDLLGIQSLGFRGEALSSISAVSQTEMITKVANDLTGVRYVINGGQEREKEEIGAPEGTTIIVRNLFFNVPARRKFLKTPQTESSAIVELMQHLAMSHPEISFKFMQSGQIRFHTSGNGDLKEIIYRIYGRDAANEIVPIDFESESLKIKGYLGTPTITRANRNFETCFINGRYIKSKLVSKAVEDGYGGYLMQHKFPLYVIHITLPPDRLDVNVHPAKWEVRFEEQNTLAEWIAHAVSDTLTHKEMIKTATLPGDSEPKVQTTRKPLAEKIYMPEPFEIEAKKREGFLSLTQEVNGAERSDPPSDNNFRALPLTERVNNLSGNVIKRSNAIVVEKPAQMNLFDEKILKKERRHEYRIIGQVFDTYWLIEFEEKLLLIDQHAAHEKIKYERILKQVETGGVASQSINPPIIVSLSGSEEAVYKEYADTFAALGFETEHFGGNEYAIRAVPTDLFGCGEKELFLNVMDELSSGGMAEKEPSVIRSKIASMACKAAVKGNMHLSIAEAEKLIDELMELDNPYHCPHGRPTIITISKYEMEKKFSRIVT